MLAKIAFCAALTTENLTCGALPMAKKDRPNILWFCTDQQRFDTIAALGNEHISTPNLDRLCASGTAFTRAYCQAPICTPSRSSFLTGMYPSTIGASRNGNAYFADRFPLLPKILADEGYRCGNVGKLHLASAFKGVEPRVDDGYSEFYYSHAPRDAWEEGHDYADWVKQKGGNLAELSMDSDGVPAEFHQSTWAADRSIEFAGRKDPRPWFLSVNVYDPHPPFNPPKLYREMFPPQSLPGPHFIPEDLEQQKYLESIDFQSHAQHPEALDIPNPVLPVDPAPDPDNPGGETAGERDAQTLISAYYAMIRLIDDQLGRILDALEDSGQAENTIVVFSSDHGETLGDHGLILKGCRFYEGLVRVPLIWSWPGHIQANAVRDDLVAQPWSVAVSVPNFTTPSIYRITAGPPCGAPSATSLWSITAPARASFSIWTLIRGSMTISGSIRITRRSARRCSPKATIRPLPLSIPARRAADLFSNKQAF